MKKLLLLITLFLAPQFIYAGVQNGRVIPDAIELYNSSETAIEIHGSSLDPYQSLVFDTSDQGTFTIKAGKRVYKIAYPTYDPHGPSSSENFTTAHIDVSTVQLMAQDLHRIFPGGLDSVSIINDTHYPIAIVYVLNKMRSRSRIIDPQETVSKVVGTETVQRTGFLELTDNNHKKHIFMFPRRMYKRSSSSQQKDWQEITLRAETIAWFDKGFKVTVR